MDEHVLAAVIANDEAKTLLRVEEFDDALALANDLGGHSTATATAAATKAAAATTAAEATATAAAVAAATAAITEGRPIAEAAASAAVATATAALLKPYTLFAETLFAENIVALVAAAATAVPLAPSIETHEPSELLPPAYPKKPTRSGQMAQLVAARNHSRTVHALTLKIVAALVIESGRQSAWGWQGTHHAD
jgi:hypothetical protein